MEAKGKMTFDQYVRMRDRNADYARALARTNLALRCWERAGRDIGYLPLLWLLDNHIVQAFYRRSGIDVIPLSAGGMYGYGRKVAVFPENCRSVREAKELSRIATGSCRVDNPHTRVSVTVSDALQDGENPLGLIERAALAAVGGWPAKCACHGCRHQKDADVYLTIRQILTLYVVMGQTEGVPMLGTEIRPLDDAERHPLMMAGFFEERSFSYEWFDAQPFWIHRRNGTLVSFRDGNANVVPYAAWCNGSVEKGLGWILQNLVA